MLEQKEAGVQLKDTVNPIKEPRLSNSASLINIFTDPFFRRERFYPQDHPVTVKVYEMLERLNPSEPVRVLVMRSKYLDGPSGYAFPYLHTIVVTEKFLGEASCDEEIYWLLAHELSHVERCSTVKNLSELRDEELKADLAALERLDKSGINPYGAFVRFDNRIKELEIESSRSIFSGPSTAISLDFSHGSPYFRRQLVLEVFRAREFKSLSDELTPNTVKPVLEQHYDLVEFSERLVKEMSLEEFFIYYSSIRDEFPEDFLYRQVVQKVINENPVAQSDDLAREFAKFLLDLARSDFEGFKSLDEIYDPTVPSPLNQKISLDLLKWLLKLGLDSNASVATIDEFWILIAWCCYVNSISERDLQKRFDFLNSPEFSEVWSLTISYCQRLSGNIGEQLLCVISSLVIGRIILGPISQDLIQVASFFDRQISDGHLPVDRAVLERLLESQKNMESGSVESKFIPIEKAIHYMMTKGTNQQVSSQNQEKHQTIALEKQQVIKVSGGTAKVKLDALFRLQFEEKISIEELEKVHEENEYDSYDEAMEESFEAEEEDYEEEDYQEEEDHKYDSHDDGLDEIDRSDEENLEALGYTVRSCPTVDAEEDYLWDYSLPDEEDLVDVGPDLIPLFYYHLPNDPHVQDCENTLEAIIRLNGYIKVLNERLLPTLERLQISNFDVSLLGLDFGRFTALGSLDRVADLCLRHLEEYVEDICQKLPPLTKEDLIQYLQSGYKVVYESDLHQWQCDLLLSARREYWLNVLPSRDEVERLKSDIEEKVEHLSALKEKYKVSKEENTETLSALDSQLSALVGRLRHSIVDDAQIQAIYLSCCNPRIVRILESRSIREPSPDLTFVGTLPKTAKAISLTVADVLSRFNNSASLKNFLEAIRSREVRSDFWHFMLENNIKALRCLCYPGCKLQLVLMTGLKIRRLREDALKKRKKKQNEVCDQYLSLHPPSKLLLCIPFGVLIGNFQEPRPIRQDPSESYVFEEILRNSEVALRGGKFTVSDCLRFYLEINKDIQDDADSGDILTLLDGWIGSYYEKLNQSLQETQTVNLFDELIINWVSRTEMIDPVENLFARTHSDGHNFDRVEVNSSIPLRFSTSFGGYERRIYFMRKLLRSVKGHIAPFPSWRKIDGSVDFKSVATLLDSAQKSFGHWPFFSYSTRSNLVNFERDLFFALGSVLDGICLDELSDSELEGLIYLCLVNHENPNRLRHVSRLIRRLVSRKSNFEEAFSAVVKFDFLPFPVLGESIIWIEENLPLSMADIEALHQFIERQLLEMNETHLLLVGHLAEELATLGLTETEEKVAYCRALVARSVKPELILSSSIDKVYQGLGETWKTWVNECMLKAVLIDRSPPRDVQVQQDISGKLVQINVPNFSQGSLVHELWKLVRNPPNDHRVSISHVFNFISQSPSVLNYWYLFVLGIGPQVMWRTYRSEYPKRMKLTIDTEMLLGRRTRGAFYAETDRFKILNELIEDFIGTEEQKTAHLRDLAASLAKVTNDVSFLYNIGPILATLAALPQKRPVEEEMLKAIIMEFSKKYAGEHYTEVKRPFKGQRFDLTQGVTAGALALALAEASIEWEWQADEVELEGYVTGGKRKYPYLYLDFNLRLHRARNFGEVLDRVLELAEDLKTDLSELDFLDLLILTAENWHVLGRRMIQLYTVLQGDTLDPVERKKLERSFSRTPVVYQSQLPQIIESENNEHVSAFIDTVQRILPERRGGSISTVFFMETLQAEERKVFAVHVSNPNNLYFLRDAQGLVQRIIDISNLSDDQKKMARQLLNTAGVWIEGEILDPHFYSNHNEYRNTYSNDTTNGMQVNELLCPSGKVRLLIPKFLDTHSVNFRVQELAEGLTFDEINWDSFSLEEKVEIGKTLIKWLFHQIFVRGILHSNIHPGNLVVTRSSEGEIKITILDTKNILRFDQSFIQDLFFAIREIAFSGNPLHGINQLLQLCLIKSEGQPNLEIISAEIESMVKDSSNKSISSIVQNVFSLLLKNNCVIKDDVIISVQSMFGILYCMNNLNFSEEQIQQLFIESALEMYLCLGNSWQIF
ncbi:MAG: AarF/UbiB family protein [Deltaproteobacteria bacterium]|nr:AarF/UbiB family protein [Deltaproteobacteria bacterium]